MSKTSDLGPARFSQNEQIDRMLNQVVSCVRQFAETQVGHIKRLTQIGIALSAEKNRDRLLEMIVDEARKFTNADGGSLYIVSDDGRSLRFAIVQNDSLRVRMGGTSGEITWPSIDLYHPDGSPSHSHVCAHSALTGEVVNIPDVYDYVDSNDTALDDILGQVLRVGHPAGNVPPTTPRFYFGGTRQFDAKTGYRSKSMLVAPMRNHENDIIGVLQLLNARDVASGDVIAFSAEYQELTESLASQAAVALTNNRLIHDLEHLFESFIKAIAAGIDEKSPYTGGHVQRVADLTMTIARRINEVCEGPYASVHFSEDELRELQIAAWMHDVGKVTTPEYIINKSTKLETIHDRIDAVKARFEVAKRDLEMEFTRSRSGAAASSEAVSPERYQEEIRKLEDDFSFLASVNVGGEFTPNESIERVKAIAAREWRPDGAPQPLLSPDEVYNLSIRKGTLTEEERDVINSHAAVTLKMLSQLPFPKKLRNVPAYATAHHEKLDGTGYPQGLKGDQIPLQARMIALADIFEALTARDRPYKKDKTLSETVKIMGFMAKDNHIDPTLFQLFVKQKLYLDYAVKELAPHQIDEVKL